MEEGNGDNIQVNTSHFQHFHIICHRKAILFYIASNRPVHDTYFLCFGLFEHVMSIQDNQVWNRGI